MSDLPIDEPVAPKIAPEIIAVLAANQAFYDAHERRDIDAMRAVWEHSDRVVCTHPGLADPADLAGRRGLVAADSRWSGRNQFILTNEAVTIHGDMAWVTLDENLVDAGGTGTVAATNLFVRTRRRPAGCSSSTTAPPSWSADRTPRQAPR